MTGKKQPESTGDYMRIIEVANMLHCSTTTAYKLVDDGSIPALRVRGMIRIPRTRFLAWIAENSTGNAAPSSAA